MRQRFIASVLVLVALAVVYVGSYVAFRCTIWMLSDDGSAWNLIRARPETRTSKVIYTRRTHPTANPDL